MTPVVTDSPRKGKVWIALLTFLLALLPLFLLPSGFSLSARATASIFVIAVGFWAFEVIPLYATSLLVVLLLSFSLGHPRDWLHFGSEGYQVFLVPFSSPVIMLFLGGFVLAAAVKKHHVDAFCVSRFLGHLGRRPAALLIGFLSITALFSMWISNTAATAMMLLFLKPVIEEIDADDPFRKALVLSVALGANLGGLGTPIGTPPNAIAIGILAERGIVIDFLGWMLMAIPLSIVLLAISACVLLILFPSKQKRLQFSPPPKKPLTAKGIWVILIGFLIILLWLTKPIHEIPESLVALLGVGIFAAFKLISVKDFRSIDWDILVLMWGGLALGQAISMTHLIEPLIESPFFGGEGILIVATFAGIAVVLSSFISNTATANLLLPVAISVSGYDKTLLSITVALACSFALAFPISTPPNAMVYGTGMLKTRDMFRAGGIIAICALILLLVGYETVIRLTLLDTPLESILSGLVHTFTPTR